MSGRKLQTNDNVQTPNGPGVFQCYLYSEGTVLPAVSHPASQQIDTSKCVGYMGDGKGFWWFCTYKPEEVTA